MLMADEKHASDRSAESNYQMLDMHRFPAVHARISQSFATKVMSSCLQTILARSGEHVNAPTAILLTHVMLLGFFPWLWIEAIGYSC